MITHATPTRSVHVDGYGSVPLPTTRMLTSGSRMRTDADIETEKTGHDPRTCVDCRCEGPCTGQDCACRDMDAWQVEDATSGRR